MRISIVGAGVGGCAAALALGDHEVTVHEAHPTLAADAGAFLTLAANGFAALEKLGVAERVRGVGFGLDELRVIDAAGDEIAARPLPAYQCLRWGEFVAALQDEVVRRGVPIHHGRRLTELPADGIVIGADGINSTVRRLIDPAARPRRYAGQRVFYGYSRYPGAAGRITMVRGRTAFGYATSPDGETYWFARVTAPELPASEPALPPADRRTHENIDWRGWLLDRLDRGPAEIVAASDERLRVTNSYDLPDVTTWHTDRALIIGDAAHAASPATGQGASLALEDAVVLADELRRTDDPIEAFRRYEAIRRPPVTANIEAGARMAAPENLPTPGR